MLARMKRVVLALVLVACGGGQKILTTTDELGAVRGAWLNAFNAKQLDAVLATYSLDAVFLPITGDRVISSAAIKNLYERIWKRFTPRIELTSHIVERSADLGYESGEYVENITAGEASLNIAGNYVFVYRREPDGWKIVEQIWTERGGGHPTEAAPEQ